ncbi:MAG: alpha/beta fold hydrolase, partial [Bacteroidota bacterium]
MHRSRLVPYFLIFLGLYFLVCLTLYFVQERLLFFPFKLPQDYSFRFNTAFEDLTLTAKDGVNLNALHFKTPNPKGAVLFLHGNGGSIDGWGTLYPMYTQNGYDVLFFDYRGYGKSEGKISSQQQLIDDAQLAYDYLKAHFPENRLIISGTSIGTGIATILAGQNQPKQLILNS